MPRFMRKGVTKFYWVPTIASPTLIPTSAEVIAGTNLTPQLAEVNGFNFANSPINTPDMSSAFVGKIPGEDTTDNSDITFYEDKVTNPIKTAQAKGNVGYVVIFYAGTAGASPAAGDKVDVWPAIVASNSRMYTADNEAAKYRVVYALTAAPGEEKTLT
jgi:hypothetical protein